MKAGIVNFKSKIVNPWTSSPAKTRPGKRRNGWYCILTLAVVLLIVAVYFIALIVFAGVQAKQHRLLEAEPVQFCLVECPHFPWLHFRCAGVIFIGSAYKTSELSAGGGGTVATLMGGRLVNHATTDPNERKLLNVVEEMSIASGVPMPQVYVLQNERGINAFAAGHTTGDAAIGVTRGCIDLLSG